MRISKKEPTKPITKLEQARQVRKQKVRKKRIFYFLFFIFCIILLVLFFRIPFFFIKNIQVVGLESIPVESVQETINQYMAGNKAFVFSRRNIFIFNKKTVITKLRNDYPKVKAVDINKNLFSNITVAISEYQPSLLWCGVSYNQEGDCYYVSDEGVIYEKSPKFSKPIYFVFFAPVSTPDNPFGNVLLDSDTRKKAQQLKHEFSIQGTSLFAFEKKDTTDNILYLDSNSEYHPYIIFRDDQSVTTVLSNFSTALKSEKLKNSKINNFIDMSYVDLRFDGKVFYKLK